MTISFLDGAVRQAHVVDATDHRPWPLPETPWTSAQSWVDLGFLHWRAGPDQLRKLLPGSVELETFDGSAWLGVVPFVLTDLRLRGLPPVPRYSTFPELNVRTYVTRGDRPGIWFFSLDAASRLFVEAANTCTTSPRGPAGRSAATTAASATCSRRRPARSRRSSRSATASTPRTVAVSTARTSITRRGTCSTQRPEST